MSDDLTLQSQGRQIRLEPLAPGLWGMILGLVLAALGPLFGFLGGSIIGPGPGGASLNPMYLSLFVGILAGALGLAVAAFNGYRLYRHMNAASAARTESVSA